MKKPQVELHITDYGVVTLELEAEKAPLSTKNFLSYVESGFYNGTIFHRVIHDFMIQGGGFTPQMKEKKTQEPIDNEADNGLQNVTYSVAMARTSDPHSASSQFFINVVDNDFLDHQHPSPSGWGYCVFAHVIQGHEIIDRIKAVKTSKKGFHRDVPVTPVIIEKAVVA